MNLESYNAFAIISSIIWIAGSGFIITPSKIKIYRITGKLLIPAGIIALSFFFIDSWHTLSRPPYKTVGEIRLYFALFYSIISYIIYLKWNFKWFLVFGLLFSISLLLINIFKPENFKIFIDPVLQSPWFFIRVIVYIFSYALLSAASTVAIKGIITINKNKFKAESLEESDNLIHIGLGFLTMGLLFSIIWSKQAFGSYWSGDYKEIWIIFSWILNVLYIHYRNKNPERYKTAIYLLIAILIVLIISWILINIIPFGQESLYII